MKKLMKQLYKNIDSAGFVWDYQTRKALREACNNRDTKRIKAGIKFFEGV